MIVAMTGAVQGPSIGAGSNPPPAWSTLAGNVGFGPTCDSVVQAFMSSPEHRRNILGPSYSSLGVGVVDGPDGLMYVTEDFMGTAGTSVQAAQGPAPTPVQAP